MQLDIQTVQQGARSNRETTHALDPVKFPPDLSYAAACDHVADQCREAIARGDDALAHKELLAILNDDPDGARRFREMEDRRERIGLRVVNPTD